MRHPFSLGTPISVSMLYPTLNHLPHLKLVSVSMVCHVIKAKRNLWYLINGKRQPLPDLKNSWYFRNGRG